MSMDSATLARDPEIPAHVAPELVYPYNVFEPNPDGGDVFEALYALKRQAPPVFWTPHNGGHWYVVDGALARKVYEDPEHFSSQMLMLQREANPPKGEGLTPIHLDPPEHGPYRQLMLQALSRRTVVDMMVHIRRYTVDLIERTKPKGRCNFAADIAYLLPTQVFIHLVNLPLEYLEGLEWRIAALHDVHADKAQMFVEIQEHLSSFVSERIAHPGDDLISWLSRQQVNGEPIAKKQLDSIAAMLLTAGLGTITDTYASIFRWIADHPEQRAYIKAHPEKMNGVVEELFRRFPVMMADTARLCVKDQTLGAARIRPDDIVLATPAMMNFEDQFYENPLEVDFDRVINHNGTFSHGPHKCIGAPLARALLAILIEEWLDRIPDFWVSKSEPCKPVVELNLVYPHLIFEWPTD
jgi:cytochrome P450